MERDAILSVMKASVGVASSHDTVAARCRSHSVATKRFQLFVVFTTRDNLIRVISARDMNRKERKIYEAL